MPCAVANIVQNAGCVYVFDEAKRRAQIMCCLRSGGPLLAYLFVPFVTTSNFFIFKFLLLSFSVLQTFCYRFNMGLVKKASNVTGGI